MSVTTAVLASPLLAQPPATPPPGGGCGGGIGGALCGVGNAVGGAVGSVAGAAAGSAFDSIVGELSQGVGKAVGLMMSFWMHIPIPSIGDGSAADRLHQATVYLTVITAVISLFFAAGKFALASRSASAEAGEEAVKGLVRVVVASVVIVPAAILASQAADSYSTWLVGQAANGDVPAAIEKLSGVPQALGIGFTFIMAILALVASIVQAFLILIRDALLILLVGALPLAAAASITGAGRQTWTKLIGWLIAFIVFKPVAAMVYATALWSVTDTSSPFNQVAGLFLVILAVFTLPALMRLIVPQVQQVGSGGGVALAGAAAGVATGAKETSGKGSSSGGSGGGGQAGGGKQGKAQFLGEQGSSPSGSKGGGAGGSAPGGGSPGGGGGPSGPGGGSPVGAPGGAPGGPGGGGASGGGAAGGQAAGAAAGVGVAAAQKVYQGAKSTGAVTSGAGAGAADGT